MVFHIGSQSAQVINNAAGDQHNEFTTGTSDPTVILSCLRDALTEADLTPGVAAEAQAHLARVEADLSAPQPNRSGVATHLHGLTQLLLSAGAVITAATPLGAPIAALAHWVGGAGESTRALIPD
jgi:hypothetical protein